MPNQAQKQATCPVCGLTETAGDSQALELAMQEHLRLMHNQVASTSVSDDTKNASSNTDMGPGTTKVMPPMTNAGNFGQFPVPEHNTDTSREP